MITVIYLFKNQHPPPFVDFYWPAGHGAYGGTRSEVARGASWGVAVLLGQPRVERGGGSGLERCEKREWKEFMLKEARCQRNIKIKNASEWNMDFVDLSGLVPPRDVFIVVLHDLWQVLRIRGFSMMPWWKPLAIFYLLSPRSKDHVEQVAGVPFFGTWMDMGHTASWSMSHLQLGEFIMKSFIGCYVLTFASI